MFSQDFTRARFHFGSVGERLVTECLESIKLKVVKARLGYGLDFRDDESWRKVDKFNLTRKVRLISFQRKFCSFLMENKFNKTIL